MGAIRGYYRENSQLLYATILDTFTKPFLNGSRNEWSDEIERISDTGSHSARISLRGAQSAQDERSYIFASHVPIIY